MNLNIRYLLRTFKLFCLIYVVRPLESFSTEQLYSIVLQHLCHFCIFVFLAEQPLISTTMLQEVTLLANHFIHSLRETHSASARFA